MMGAWVFLDRRKDNAHAPVGAPPETGETRARSIANDFSNATARKGCDNTGVLMGGCGRGKVFETLCDAPGRGFTGATTGFQNTKGATAIQPTRFDMKRCRLPRG
jgi:hypothetical protein